MYVLRNVLFKFPNIMIENYIITNHMGKTIKHRKQRTDETMKLVPKLLLLSLLLQDHSVAQNYKLLLFEGKKASSNKSIIYHT